MALQSCRAERVGSESLEKWESIGSGGFGQVYKARHKDWRFDVAVKLFHEDPGYQSRTLVPKEKALFEEVIHMDKASCEFVLRVYGIYDGNAPFGGLSVQKGIVMEFMGKGSVEDLLTVLSGPPPWSLAFRLSHQVALGMNFLHSRKLMHHDLKPSNVLLNDDLNAKIADFGLSRVSTSAFNSNRGMTAGVGGTYKYMPPEAFETSYEPVRAFDIYSYGVLLWSIVTGKEPYPRACYSLVAIKIPEGQRPPCEEIDVSKVEGLNELVDLMKICWDADPSKRPCFKDCLAITENVFSLHKKGIRAAVHQVLTRLESPTSNHHVNPSVPFSSSPQEPEKSKSHETVDHVVFTTTEKSPTQDLTSVSTRTMSNNDKATFIDNNKKVLIQDVSEVMAIVEELGDMVHRETYSEIEAEKTSQKKMRALFQRTMRSGGVTVKAAFYDALNTHQPQLMERLGAVL